MTAAQRELLGMIVWNADRGVEDVFVSSSGGNALRALARRGLVTFSRYYSLDRVSYLARPTDAGREACS